MLTNNNSICKSVTVLKNKYDLQIWSTNKHFQKEVVLYYITLSLLRNVAYTNQLRVLELN